jgi:high-affinity iron transporter
MGTGIVLLREGFEISLVVVICLAYLKRAGRQAQSWAVWAGVAAALLVSTVAGGGLLLLGHDLSGHAEAIWEGTTVFAAAAALTWMVFWMRRNSRMIKGDLEQGLDSALGRGSLWGLALVAFIGVVREGLETALLVAGAAAGTKPLTALIGGVAGAGVAIVLGYIFYRGSHRLDLRRFFSYTSVILLLFAAWLVARGVKAFAEAGWMPSGLSLQLVAFVLFAAVIGSLWHRAG